MAARNIGMTVRPVTTLDVKRTGIRKHTPTLLAIRSAAAKKHLHSVIKSGKNALSSSEDSVHIADARLVRERA
jgi:hypothetical protein